MKNWHMQWYLYISSVTQGTGTISPFHHFSADYGLNFFVWQARQSCFYPTFAEWIGRVVCGNMCFVSAETAQCALAQSILQTRVHHQERVHILLTLLYTVLVIYKQHSGKTFVIVNIFNFVLVTVTVLYGIFTRLVAFLLLIYGILPNSWLNRLNFRRLVFCSICYGTFILYFTNM